MLIPATSPEFEPALTTTVWPMQHGDRSHWDAAYEAGDEVSWFQPSASTSLELIGSVSRKMDVGIVDVGGGSSTLVDGLLDRGYSDVSVLDISPNSLVAAQARLADRVTQPNWMVADLLNWDPPRMYDIWHDRAVLHFLSDEADRERYRAALGRGTTAGGHVVIGVFAEDGPTKCSGLDVRRHSQADLADFLGEGFETQEMRREEHRTPSGKVQAFNWIVSRRTAVR